VHLSLTLLKAMHESFNAAKFVFFGRICRDADVRSLSEIASSTKALETGDKQKTGEKGLGFKSVFTISGKKGSTSISAPGITTAAILVLIL